MQWRMGYHGVVLGFMPVLRRVLEMWLLWMIADLNYVSANYQEIREENLKTILTPTEWMSIIGSTNQDILYSLTYPRVPYINSVLVSGNNNSEPSHVLSLATKHLGTFQVQLEPSPDLLSTNFVALVTDANDTNILDRYHLTADVTRCYYRGQNSALSLCNGIKGILHFTPSHSYFIHPLPDRFHNGTSKPHVIVRRKIESLVDNNSFHQNAHCAHEKDYENRFLKQKLKKRKTEFSGFVNTKDVVRHQGCNASCNSTNSKSNESSNLTDAESIDKCIKQCDFKSDKLNGKKRSKREFPADSHVFVETAVFVDRDLFDHMKTNFPVNTERELIRFVLAMINAVQLLYHDSSLGRPVNFLLKRLEILREEAPGLSRPPDIDRYLSNFCNWQRTKNPVGDREPQHWDHALILTGLDLYVRGKHGKISSQVVGLAPVAGMCTSTSSCTVNEGRHFESVYVVAHEIGHNLGMRHDGPLADNDCDPSSYIMSPTLGSGKITWSSCSRHYLQKFLDTPQSRCLLDHSSSAGQLDHGAEGALPGERFDANAQCMLKYGRGSRHSSQQPMDDVCRDLHCERERYTWTSHPALEGTTCGYNLWCRAGRCTRKSSSVPGVSSGAIGSSAAYTSALQSAARQEPVHGGWSRWRTTIECASGCLYGEEGRLRSGSTGIAMSTRMCNNPRAQSGGSKCDGIDKKYQACNTQQCMNVPRLTILEFAEQICARAKEVDKDLTGIGSQKISSDPEEACVVWCQKRNGGTKSRGWTFPDGTVCQTRRNKYNRQSYCINGRCEDFLCDFYEETNHQFFQQHELCPNDHDDNDIMYRNSGNNGLRRRESVPSVTGKVNKESKYSISVNTVWISASACHYNCIVPGIGLRLVMSKELRDENRAGRTSIQTCQPDQYGCGRIKSPFQHASMVCTKYKERVRRLSGLGMQISPALEDPDRPCRVACQDENIAHRFYLVNGEEGWFPFGTDCSRGMTEKKAFCISGKCLEFGSDDTPLSQSEFTLPLLSRNRRSLELNNTKVTATLRQHELDEIINKLNQTIRGQIFAGNNFEIDLNNPIQVNIDPNEMPHHYYRQNSYDYANYT